MIPKSVTIIAALLLAACDNSAQAPAADTPVVAEAGGIDRSHAGATLPDITMTSDDGEVVRLADYADGEPLLVNLWASWCAPCVKELPTLVELSTMESAGIPRVLTLSQDMGPATSVRAFLDDQGLEAVEGWQDAEMAMTDALSVRIMPTTVLYDAQGSEVWRYVGDRDWSDAEAVALVGEAF
ncbi:TlpA disulfide reductase family protein [Sphingomicrobium sp. XHP0239]|uniref:TlpA family protein disulfide reductase n=1 Tax=Sphingomicrobium maritimum TaxID=3133972 RepID=UPI0031CCC6F3